MFKIKYQQTVFKKFYVFNKVENIRTHSPDKDI